MSEEQKTAPESTQSNGAKSKTPMIIGAVVVVVVVIAVVVAFLMMNQGGGNTEEALATCERNATALEAHTNALATAQESADEAAALTEADVADPSVFDDLTAAQEAVDALGEAPSCPADGSAQDIEAATEQIKQYANDLRAATNDLDAAAKAVIASNEELTGAAE